MGKAALPRQLYVVGLLPPHGTVTHCKEGRKRSFGQPAVSTTAHWNTFSSQLLSYSLNERVSACDTEQQTRSCLYPFICLFIQQMFVNTCCVEELGVAW